ncbi:MAG: PEGA domain-containing protein [Myxococcota bacterium]|nr:PEGA domain-containing protein [Myxococcota bacterium]
MGRTRLAMLALLAGTITLCPPRARAQDAAPAEPAPAEPAPAEPAPAEPAPSAGEDTPAYREALERFEDAQRVFDQGDYRAALAEFQRIYDLLEGHPNRHFVLFNLGRSYEELHRYDRAIQMYQRYLDEGGAAAEDRADVEASLRALERLLGTVVIVLEGSEPPETAEVWLGEWQVGQAPGEVHIPAGQHVIEIRAPGYETARREIEVPARRSVGLSLELGKLSDFRGLHPAAFISTTVLAVGALAVGIGFGIHALSLNADATTCRNTPHCSIDVETRRREIRDTALVADVLYGTAGLFAVTSLVLAFLTDWGSAPTPELMSPDSALQLTPAFGPDGASLQLRASF